MDLIGWLIAPLATAMLIERGDAVGAWMINSCADALPDEARELFREEWLADLARVDGKAWKIWFGFGIFVRCLPAVLRKIRSKASSAANPSRVSSLMLRRLRKKFSPEAWNSILNAAALEAEEYDWHDPMYRVEFIEDYIFKHGKMIGKEIRSIERLRRRSIKASVKLHRRQRTKSLKGRR